MELNVPLAALLIQTHMNSGVQREGVDGTAARALAGHLYIAGGNPIKELALKDSKGAIQNKELAPSIHLNKRVGPEHHQTSTRHSTGILLRQRNTTRRYLNETTRTHVDTLL